MLDKVLLDLDEYLSEQDRPEQLEECSFCEGTEEVQRIFINQV